jgi:hypothetical protein
MVLGYPTSWRHIIITQSEMSIVEISPAISRHRLTFGHKTVLEAMGTAQLGWEGALPANRIGIKARVSTTDQYS